jgi:hypothetical protein
MDARGHDQIQSAISFGIHEAVDEDREIGAVVLPHPEYDSNSEYYLADGENARYVTISYDTVGSEFILNILNKNNLMYRPHTEVTSNEGPKLKVLGIALETILLEDMSAS